MLTANKNSWKYSVVDHSSNINPNENASGNLTKEDQFECCGVSTCEGCASCGCKYPFQLVNFIAAFLHLASAVTMLIIYVGIEAPLEVPYTETFISWNKLPDECASATAISNISSACLCVDQNQRPLVTADGTRYCIGPKLEPIPDSGVNLGILIIAFHGLSFLFQGIAWLQPLSCKEGLLGFRYQEDVEGGKNYLRFLEYSFSASIMLVAIALLNGIFDINLVACITVLTAATQLCGLAAEYLLAQDEEKNFMIATLLHLVGWLQFFCAYGVIFHAYIRSATNDPDVQPPWFVTLIVIVIFILYGIFGAVQLSELCCLKPPIDGCCDGCGKSCRVGEPGKSGRINVQCKEMSYVVLSLVSKLTLGWLIYFNFLIRSD